MISEKNGIKALGIFLIFGSIMSLLAAITLLYPNTILTKIWAINPSAYNELQPFARIAGVGFVFLVPILVVASYGLFNFKKWGWKLAVGVIGANLLGDIANFMRGEYLKGLVGVTITGFILFYLTRVSIRRYFK